MGSFAPKGRARVDPTSPRAFAICDRCGFMYNHSALNWDTQYAGRQLRRTGFLVCDACNDIPNPTLRPIVLPPDPVPILNPRSEPVHCHVFKPRADASPTMVPLRADSTKIFADSTMFTADQTEYAPPSPVFKARADTISRMFPPVDMWRDVTVDTGSVCDTRSYQDGWSVPVPPPVILPPEPEPPIEPPDATADNLEATADTTGTTVDASPIFPPVEIELNTSDTILVMADDSNKLVNVFPDYLYAADIDATLTDDTTVRADNLE